MWRENCLYFLMVGLLFSFGRGLQLMCLALTFFGSYLSHLYTQRGAQTHDHKQDSFEPPTKPPRRPLIVFVFVFVFFNEHTNHH